MVTEVTVVVGNPFKVEWTFQSLSIMHESVFSFRAVGWFVYLVFKY